MLPSTHQSLPLNDSFINSFHFSLMMFCYNSTLGASIWFAFSITNALLILPLSIFVLCLGCKQWRHHRLATVSHCDFITYNMATLEVIGAVSWVLSYAGVFADLNLMRSVSQFLANFSFIGQCVFPMLICVESYLAAVHPVIYLGLKQGGGVRIRNISTACVWITCFLVASGNSTKLTELNLIPSTCSMCFFLGVTIFCCVSVVRVLIRPRPGEARTNSKHLHQSKKRAFYTIVSVMGVFLVKFGGILTVNIMVQSPGLDVSVQCVVFFSTNWFSLPSSLLLPLLFLLRAGKLPGCKR